MLQKNKKIILIIIILIFVGVITNYIFTSENNTKSIQPDIHWRESVPPYSNNIVCSLKLSAVTDFNDDRLSVGANIDKNPTALTFVDIDTNTPSIIGNLGDREHLAKIENGDTVYLIEETDFGNINIFTLFRDKNIMIMTKQYDFSGIPFGLLMIGDYLPGS